MLQCFWSGCGFKGITRILSIRVEVSENRTVRLFEALDFNIVKAACNSAYVCLESWNGHEESQ